MHAFLKLISTSESIRKEGVDEIAKLKTGYRGITYVSCCRFALRTRLMTMDLPEGPPLEVTKFCTPNTHCNKRLRGRHGMYGFGRLSRSKRCIADLELSNMHLRISILMELVRHD